MLSTYSESAAGTSRSSDTWPPDLPKSRSAGNDGGVVFVLTPKMSLNLPSSSSADNVAAPAAVGVIPRAANRLRTLSTPCGVLHSLRRRIWSLINAFDVETPVADFVLSQSKLQVCEAPQYTLRRYHVLEKTVTKNNNQRAFSLGWLLCEPATLPG